MKSFELAPPDVAELAATRRSEFYPDLDSAGVTIAYVFATNDTGPAIMSGGYPALATARIVNPKDRAKGLDDAEITIDAARWQKMTEEQKAALLDHELHHIRPQEDDSGGWKKDAQGRPRLRLAKHDVQVGWFTEVAERHGSNSVEVTQARLVWEENGQAFFPFLTEAAQPLTLEG